MVNHTYCQEHEHTVGLNIFNIIVFKIFFIALEDNSEGIIVDLLVLEDAT